MLLTLPQVLSSSELEVVQSELRRAKFQDGKLSAGMFARRVKENEELNTGSIDVERLNNLVMGRLVQHSVYRAGAMPLRVAAPYYARYGVGMGYGEHTDDPIMQADFPYRSDIAITLFLNDTADYDGGELEIRTPFGMNQVKLPAGDAVMYPASSRHRVAPVTRGERLVAVTWVQSAVRDSAQRELLYELNLAREKMLHESPDAEETAQVNHAYVNLLRMWAEL